jgi:hypothetical protein
MLTTCFQLPCNYGETKEALGWYERVPWAAAARRLVGQATAAGNDFVLTPPTE